MLDIYTNAFTEEKFNEMVDYIINQEPPEHYFETLASKKTILSFETDNPTIIELQNKLRNMKYGNLLILYDKLGYAYLNELIRKELKEQK